MPVDCLDDLANKAILSMKDAESKCFTDDTGQAFYRHVIHNAVTPDEGDVDRTFDTLPDMVTPYVPTPPLTPCEGCAHALREPYHLIVETPAVAPTPLPPSTSGQWEFSDDAGETWQAWGGGAVTGVVGPAGTMRFRVIADLDCDGRLTTSISGTKTDGEDGVLLFDGTAVADETGPNNPFLTQFDVISGNRTIEWRHGEITTGGYNPEPLITFLTYTCLPARECAPLIRIQDCDGNVTWQDGGGFAHVATGNEVPGFCQLDTEREIVCLTPDNGGTVFRGALVVSYDQLGNEIDRQYEDIFGNDIDGVAVWPCEGAVNPEVGCLVSAAQADISGFERCNITEVVFNGETIDVDLAAGWTPLDLVNAINAVRPNTLALDAGSVVSATGLTLANLQVVCSEEQFLEDFGTGGQDGARVSTAATNYIFKASGSIDDGEYAITSFSDTGLASFNNSDGAITADSQGDANGNAIIFNADLPPGEFFRQAVATEPNVEYRVEFFAIDTVFPGAPIRPNVRVDIEPFGGGAPIQSFETGDLVPLATWLNFTFDFVAPTGAGIEFVLVNNAPGGFGNDLAIDHISFQFISRQTALMRPSQRAIPVEIIKTVSPDGGVVNVRAFSPDGTIEYPIPDPDDLLLFAGDCGSIVTGQTAQGSGLPAVIRDSICYSTDGGSTILQGWRVVSYNADGTETARAIQDHAGALVLGAVGFDCPVGGGDDEFAKPIILCDDGTPFLRHIVYDANGSVISVYTTDLTAVAAYVPSGTERPYDGNGCGGEYHYQTIQGTTSWSPPAQAKDVSIVTIASSLAGTRPTLTANVGTHPMYVGQSINFEGYMTGTITVDTVPGDIVAVSWRE